MIRELLQQLQRGELDLSTAAERIEAALLPAAALTAEATIDLDRQRRCGFPEVVYAEGKTAAAVVEIFATLQAAGQDCLATRVSPEQAAALLTDLPGTRHNPVARTVSLMRDGDIPEIGRVLVVTAGTSDRPVAEEAVETLRWMRCGVELIVDIGVAGPQRLLNQRQRMAEADAIVVAAGMEGALPSVVGGWSSCPVIAVPTSVGYGASFGGLAALLGMLNSCAANVAVVNIDAGFKAGYLAGLIAKRSVGATDAT